MSRTRSILSLLLVVALSGCSKEKQEAQVQPAPQVPPIQNPVPPAPESTAPPQHRKAQGGRQAICACGPATGCPTPARSRGSA